MADSGDEQVADQPPTEGSEELVGSIPADQEKDRVDEAEAEDDRCRPLKTVGDEEAQKHGWIPLETGGDEEAEDGLVEEVMKAISASSSPQPGEVPEVDLKQPEPDPMDSAEARESSEGVTNSGEEEALPADTPAETESVPQQEQKSEAEAQGSDG